MSFKETKRKGFNFYRSYYDVYNELEKKEDKLAFIEALLDRQFLGIKPENLKGMVKFAWISQVNAIDAQVKGYEDKTKTALLKETTTPRQGGTQGGTVGGAVRGASTPTLQEKEKEKEKGEYTLREKKEGFIKWFNDQKKIYTGKKGSIRTLSKTDENNLKRLLETYTFEDFTKAIPSLYASDWAKRTGNLTPTHFLRVDNFNKFLEQANNPTKNTDYEY